MNEMIILLLGVAAGAHFAESIRKTVPILDPNKPGTPEVTA